MKVIKIVIYSLLTLFISLFIILFTCSIFNKSFLGYYAFKIGSGSMQPYLKVNDFVIVKNTDIYKVKDVITYKDNDEYITHRIIEIQDDNIITKGDFNDLEDKPITKKKIIGKVLFKLSLFRWISDIFFKPITLVILLIIGIIITILWPNKEKRKCSLCKRKEN